MGFCYERAFDGVKIKNVTERLRRETMKHYRRHHEKLDRLSRRYRRLLLIDLHSFSDEIVPPGQLIPGRRTPDVCLGVDERFTPEKLAAAAENTLRAAGFSVDRNYPYSGCLVPNAVMRGESSCDCASIMLEWNKRCYCDEKGVPAPEKLADLRKTIFGLVCAAEDALSRPL